MDKSSIIQMEAAIDEVKEVLWKHFPREESGRDENLIHVIEAAAKHVLPYRTPKIVCC